MSALGALADQGMIATDVTLGGLTTYKLGGPARFFATPNDIEELAAVVQARIDDGVPMVVLGRGSNMVVADEGFDGLVVRLGTGFGTIDHRPDCIVAGAAVSLPMLARSAVAEGRLGLEFYVGIPGSVGGAVRQNAGCHGVETVDRLISARLVRPDGAMETVDVSGLELSYRHSNLADADIVVDAAFGFDIGDPSVGEQAIRDITRWRREHQPGGTFNAGSVFKNPPGDAAGRIIDSVGLKGLTVGGASVSTKHANFFVATPEATAADVFALVSEVRRVVRAETGIDLQPEIRFVGFEEYT